jgi:hypothetical protein
MKWHMILILVIVFVLSMAGCVKKDQGSADKTPMDAAEAAASTAGTEVWQNESFAAHMHVHAEKLDDLNFALADGDLEAAKASAHWLSTHDSDNEIQADWLPHLYRMRGEAEAVEAAPDIATAQAAALRINVQCQECHTAVGISTP